MRTCREKIAVAFALCMLMSCASAVDVRAYVIAKTNGDVASSPSHVIACISDMNMVYSQVGLSFNLVECSVVISNELYVVDYTNAPSRTALCNYVTSTGGLELYFVGEIASSQVRAFYTKRGIVVGPDATPRDVSHEVGHACGWKDIYESHSGTSLAVEGRPIQEWMPDDWSPFYPRNMTQASIIQMLLMYGRSGEGHVDIPAGDVRGLWYINVFDHATHRWTRDWRISLAPVSSWHGMNRNPQSE